MLGLAAAAFLPLLARCLTFCFARVAAEVAAGGLATFFAGRGLGEGRGSG